MAKGIANCLAIGEPPISQRASISPCPARNVAGEEVALGVGCSPQLGSPHQSRNCAMGAERKAAPLIGFARVIGVDGYNQSVTGEVAMTVTSKRADPHHVPCAIVKRSCNGKERRGGD